MALPENRKAVLAVLKELNPLIVGKNHEGFGSYGPSFAVSIEPAGDLYPGQEVMWPAWSVILQEIEDHLSYWTCSLSSFVETDELDKLFLRHFGNQAGYTNPYQLQVSDAQRFRSGLPPAVRIRMNSDEICFHFDWGTAQVSGKQLSKICEVSSGSIPASDSYFDQIVHILEKLDPEVYVGGPDPELPFESSWSLDYHAALARASQESKSVFFLSMGSLLYRGDEVFTNTDLYFKLK